MQLIVGLGNPGREYRLNRHNAGFMAIDRVAESKWESKFKAEVIKIDDFLLVKPQTFMNQSGVVVAEIVKFYKVEPGNLWVIHDDLDIRLGEFKIQMGIGPKVHNGVTSIEQALDEKNFWRVRMGIDNRIQPRSAGSSQARSSGEGYVLSDFSEDELATFRATVETALAELMVKIK